MVCNKGDVSRTAVLEGERACGGASTEDVFTIREEIGNPRNCCKRKVSVEKTALKSDA